MDNSEFQYWAIEKFIPYENNPRKNDHAVEKISRAIKEFGFRVPILAKLDGTVVDGHLRLKAAKKLNLKELPVMVVDDLTEAEIKAFRISINKMADLAEWDEDLLRLEFEALKEEDYNLELTGFSIEELCDILPDEEPEVFCDEDDCPAEPEGEPETKLGDVWLLGEHRLMCGDSTSIDAVENLLNGNKADMVFTDPPYNTGMTSEGQSGSGGLWRGDGRLSHMFDDNYTDDDWQSFLSDTIKTLYTIMDNNSVAYICMDWRRNHELVYYLDNVFNRSNLIVWDKMVHGLGSDYKYTHEFINVCKKGKPVLNTHQGEREYSDVWHIQRKMGKNKDHATAKPVELVERAIRHSTKKEAVVVDIFGGSGTTLIACEKLNRKCFMMELEQKYCDVIKNRWEQYTGKKAILEK